MMMVGAWFTESILCQNPKDIFGYCVANSRESLFMSLWLAKQKFKDQQPIMYASSDCHPSLDNISTILNIPLFRVAATKKMDGMDMELLKELMDEGEPNVIVVLTMGSPQKQSYDNIEEFYKKMKDTVNNLHVHIDASYGGMVYPFMKKSWLKYPFDSFNVSFHKFLDIPKKCSLLLTKDKAPISSEPCEEDIPQLLKHHKEKLLYCEDMKSYFMLLCPDAKVYHSLSHIIYINKSSYLQITPKTTKATLEKIAYNNNTNRLQEIGKLT